MNDNVKNFTRDGHVPRQGIDHLEGQLDLIEFAKQGAPSPLEPEKPFEDLPDNVCVLETITSHDIPVNRILQKAHDADLETVLVLGYGKDGSEYFASSAADGAENLWLMRRAEYNMMKICDGGYEEPSTTPPQKA